MITGMYRDTIDGVYVEVRTIWDSDLLALSWLNKAGEFCQSLMTRDDVERDIRAGILVRTYGR
jgi:hypothetical protein